MIKVFADSTCDLSEELVKRYDISILPLHIVLGDEEYLDGQGIFPDEIYRWSDANRTTPKTAAVSSVTAAEAFQPYIAQGDEIICFAISSQMSTTVNSMRLAAEDLGAEDRIHVVDSENLSTGNGLLVIEAAKMAQQGKTAQEIIARIDALKPRVRASFVVDTLTYLHRGGRCSGVAALLGGTLKLHPRISVENGRMTPGKKYRGKMQAVIRHYVDEMMEELKNAAAQRVFITHSGCDDATLNMVKEQLEQLGHFEEILTTRAGGVISSHCGPGTLGVLFIAGE